MSNPKEIRRVLMQIGSESLRLAIWTPSGWQCGFCIRILTNIQSGTPCDCGASVFRASPDLGNAVYHRNILSDSEVRRMRRTLERNWGDQDIRWMAERLEELEYDLVHERGRE